MSKLIQNVCYLIVVISAIKAHTYRMKIARNFIKQALILSGNIILNGTSYDHACSLVFELHLADKLTTVCEILTPR